MVRLEIVKLRYRLDMVGDGYCSQVHASLHLGDFMGGHVWAALFLESEEDDAWPGFPVGDSHEPVWRWQVCSLTKSNHTQPSETAETCHHPHTLLQLIKVLGKR